MRNIVWILVAVVVAGGAYLLYTGQMPRETAIEAGDAVTDTGTGAVDATEGTADEATPEAASDAAEDTTAAGAGTESATGDTTVASDAATASDTATETTEPATTGTATGTAAAEDTQEVLTVEGFDFDRVIELIENSDLEPAQKTTFRTDLELTQDDPELLQETLERLREALDL